MYTSERGCCVPNCGKTRKDITILHCFPNPDKNNDWFLKWIHATGIDPSLDPHHVHKTRRVCHDHFETKYLTWTRRLSRDAVPTLHLTAGIPLHRFPNQRKVPEQFKVWVTIVGGNLDNPENCHQYHRKRICDLHFRMQDKNRNYRLNAIAVPCLNLPMWCKPPNVASTSSVSISTKEAMFEQDDTAEITLHGSASNFAASVDFIEHSYCLRPGFRQIGADAISTTKKEATENPSNLTNKDKVENVETNADENFRPESLKDRNKVKIENVETNADDNFYTMDEDGVQDDLEDGDEINLETETQHDDVEFIDELRLDKDPETLKHSDFKCNVCHGEIVGFRYVCVQCVDWDMCASCEARGEHPEHYVLRLPAPKPYAECEPVIAAIREQIEHLLLLRNEIKSEADSESEAYLEFEAEPNIDAVTEDFDPNLTDPFSASTDRIVPKLNVMSTEQSDTVADIEANISALYTDPVTDRPQTAPKCIVTKSTGLAPGVRMIMGNKRFYILNSQEGSQAKKVKES